VPRATDARRETARENEDHAMGVLEGKVVLVTGAARGIGRECALQAAQEGAKVLVNDLGGGVLRRRRRSGHRAGAGDRRRDQAPPAARPSRTRAASPTAPTAKADDRAGPRRTFGGLHAVINPAGILRDKMFHKMDDDDWDAVIDVHLRGTYNICRAAVDHFREQEEGAFVLFTSTSGLIGNIGQANYAAAKMGIVGLSRIIAMEGARRTSAPTSSRPSPGRA
jgi:NAD(P)-dependent dehydrogenase (short-subunit alcohol dehydrogenase family)